LATFPKLKQVGFCNPGTLEFRWLTLAELMAGYGPNVPEIKAAREALASVGIKNLPVLNVALDSLHRLHLDLTATGIADLSCLRGLPVTELRLCNTKVGDLTPLLGMPLTKLVASVSRITDVAVLADFPDLEEITIPAKVSNLERLRSLPHLRYLSATWDAQNDRPAQTAEEFWKDFDAHKTSSGK
jgi:hypothetical protein